MTTLAKQQEKERERGMGAPAFAAKLSNKHFNLRMTGTSLFIVALFLFAMPGVVPGAATFADVSNETHIHQSPDTNGALALMKSTVSLAPQHNPDFTPHYSCIIFHKMRLHSSPRPDSLKQQNTQMPGREEFMLIKTVAERHHQAPHKSDERILSRRTSGFTEPALTAIPSQLHPFAFYDDSIPIFNEIYLNPASEVGLKHYRFSLQETVISPEDTLYHISFVPRQNLTDNYLTGYYHVDAASGAIQNFSAQTHSKNSTFKAAIDLSYMLIDGKQWFPSHLECAIAIESGGPDSSLLHPLTGTIKSMVSAVTLEPGEPQDAFTPHETQPARTPHGINYRYRPLTSEDSATYRYIYGSRQQRFQAKMENLQRELAKGYFPVGPLLIELRHLIGYSAFEGLKLGVGLWSSDKISKKIKVGGFYKQAFKKNLHYYGGGIEWTLINERETRLAVGYKNSRTITGEFSFLRGPTSNITELFRGLSATSMDKDESIEASLHSRFLQDFRGEVFYSYSRVNPVVSYPFYKEERQIDEPYSVHESGVRLRWNSNEPIAGGASQLLIPAGQWPTLWLNVTVGAPSHPPIKSNFTRLEAQIEQTLNFTARSTTTLRIMAGTIGGLAPPNRLYSYMGTYRPFFIEIPFMFATMSSHEFAADRFALAFLRHSIPLFPENPGSFKPQLVLLSSAGWGDISNKYNMENIRTFNKGFYESGIYFRNLLSLLIIKYGLGVHYRYGPYQKSNSIDNFSFRIGLELSL